MTNAAHRELHRTLSSSRAPICSSAGEPSSRPSSNAPTCRSLVSTARASTRRLSCLRLQWSMQGSKSAAPARMPAAAPSSIKLRVRAPVSRRGSHRPPPSAPAAPFLRARPAPRPRGRPSPQVAPCSSRTARWRRASPFRQSPSSMARGPRGATPRPPLRGRHRSLRPRAARWRRPSCRRPSVATKSARRSGCGASSWNCGRSSRSGASKTARQGPFRPVHVGWLAGCRPRPSARGLSVKKSSNARRR